MARLLENALSPCCGSIKPIVDIRAHVDGHNVSVSLSHNYFRNYIVYCLKYKYIFMEHYPFHLVPLQEELRGYRTRAALQRRLLSQSVTMDRSSVRCMPSACCRGIRYSSFSGVQWYWCSDSVPVTYPLTTCCSVQQVSASCFLISMHCWRSWIILTRAGVKFVVLPFSAGRSSCFVFHDFFVFVMTICVSLQVIFFCYW